MIWISNKLDKKSFFFLKKKKFLQPSQFFYLDATLESTWGLTVGTTIIKHFESWDHRYLKISRLLKFCYVPATSAAFSRGIFAAATNSTNQTNKAGRTCHWAVYLLRCLWPSHSVLSYHDFYPSLIFAAKHKVLWLQWQPWKIFLLW
jgi:hypothetical protein